jgi:hypothetical protein
MKMTWKILVALACLLPITAISAPAATIESAAKDPLGEALYDKYPWMLSYYYGITGDNPLLQMLTFRFDRWPEHLNAAELSKTLAEDNVVRRFFYPIVGVVQLSAAIAVRSGSYQHTIYEFDPYIVFRWANFPWNHYLVTSLAIGEGVSYASSVPSVEKRNNNNTKRLLNYLRLEATFALPQYPQVQLITLIHHRSGAFGLYHAGNSGSNVFCVGLRYIFE